MGDEHLPCLVWILPGPPFQGSVSPPVVAVVAVVVVVVVVVVAVVVLVLVVVIVVVVLVLVIQYGGGRRQVARTTFPRRRMVSVLSGSRGKEMIDKMREKTNLY